MVKYQQAEKMLEQSGEFDTTDDFTLVVQPWYTNATLPHFVGRFQPKNTIFIVEKRHFLVPKIDFSF